MKSNKTGKENILIGLLIVQIILIVVMLLQIGDLKDAIMQIGVKDVAGDDDAIGPEPTPNPTAGISADDDPFIGPKDAKVVIIEFSDFECPYCGAAAGTHQGLIQRFKSQDPSWEAPVPGLKELANQGKIKFVYRDFPLSIHKNAQKAAEASECADEQGKFWEYHDKLFENQASLGVASLKQYAADLGLDTNKFNTCLDSGEMASEVQKDFIDGQKYGVSGTPAFFMNGKLISGAQPFSVFEQIINAELAK